MNRSPWEAFGKLGRIFVEVRPQKKKQVLGPSFRHASNLTPSRRCGKGLIAGCSLSGCCTFGGWASHCTYSLARNPGCGRVEDVHGDLYLTYDLLWRYTRRNTLRDPSKAAQQLPALGSA